MELDCMVSVVEELKAKLEELDARMEAAKAEIALIEEQRAAFETVINVFDPTVSWSAQKKPPRADRSTPGRRVTDLLKGRNMRGGVLDILRDAEAPILAGELAERFLKLEGVEGSAEGLGPNLAGRFAGLLDRMAESGIVRSSAAPDGRRRLWEIAR
jgi:hypothetical protein